MTKYFIYFSIYNKNNSKYEIYCQYKIVQFSYIYNHQKYKSFYLSTLTQKGQSGKYLWALPTAFEKVDQTFIIAWKINLLNHNLLMLSQIIL